MPRQLTTAQRCAQDLADLLGGDAKKNVPEIAALIEGAFGHEPDLEPGPLELSVAGPTPYDRFQLTARIAAATARHFLMRADRYKAQGATTIRDYLDMAVEGVQYAEALADLVIQRWTERERAEHEADASAGTTRESGPLS